MTREMKYITVKGQYSFMPCMIVFEPSLNHSDVAAGLVVVSAGMCKRHEDGKWYCYGSSTTLNVSSAPDDNEIINNLFRTVKIIDSIILSDQLLQDVTPKSGATPMTSKEKMKKTVNLTFLYVSCFMIVFNALSLIASGVANAINGNISEPLNGWRFTQLIAYIAVVIFLSIDKTEEDED